MLIHYTLYQTDFQKPSRHTTMSEPVNSVNNRNCPDCDKPFHSLLYEQYKKDNNNKEPRNNKIYRCLQCKQLKDKAHNMKNKRQNIEETGDNQFNLQSFLYGNCYLVDVDFAEKKKLKYATNTVLQNALSDLRSQNSVLQAHNSMLQANLNELNSALQKYKVKEDYAEKCRLASIRDIPIRMNGKRMFQHLCIEHFKKSRQTGKTITCINGDMCHSAHYLSDYSGEDTYETWKGALNKRRFDIDDEKWFAARLKL